MTRIVLTGANGQLGFELQRALSTVGDIHPVTRKDMDLSNEHSLVAILNTIRPDIIVNPAAYTAVDKAESEPALAHTINASAPTLMARWAHAHGALLVHYSTDYVFNGAKKSAYIEEDYPDPQSEYGRSKWQGELGIAREMENFLILRTSWVYGTHGGNFLKTMLRLMQEREQLSVVADQHGAPTGAALIADVTAQILGRYLNSHNAFSPGTYHLAADGVTSWHLYAQLIADLAKRHGIALKMDASDILPISSADYPTPAQRPLNSRLNTQRLRQQFAITLPPWENEVERVITALAERS